MSMEPALRVLDPALQRDDGPAARNHTAGDGQRSGAGGDRADEFGVRFVGRTGFASQSFVWAASDMAVSSIVMIQPPWTVFVRLQKRASGVA